MKRPRTRPAAPEPRNSDARRIEHADAEFDLDALMVKVRAAANNGDTSLPPALPASDVVKTEPIDVLQVIAAQIDWNHRTVATLGALSECVRQMQAELTALHELVRSNLARPAHKRGASVSGGVVDPRHRPGRKYGQASRRRSRR